MIAPLASPLRVTVLTGFLGSGKTTLLNRWVRAGLLRQALVLINEYGEVGLDHDLIEDGSDTPVVELSNGCSCCTIRGDLVRTLARLARRRAQGELAFEQVLIETTGLADPAPILHTLMTGPSVALGYRLDGVVATVDSLTGQRTLERHPESLRQAALADQLVITKQDLAVAPEVEALRVRLRRLNPGAARRWSEARGATGLVQPFALGLYDPSTKSADARAWLQAEAYPGSHHGHEHAAAEHDSRHDDGIRSFCMWLEEPIGSEVLEQWLGALGRLAGPDLLRVKGIVNVAGYAGPWVVHGVQHVLHPPYMLRSWPSADRRTRIVFIVREIEQAEVRAALEIFRSFEQRGRPQAGAETFGSA